MDDDSDSRDILSVVLGEAGFHVETATDAHQALEKLQTFPADVVLSDLQMPGMSGLELIRAMRVRGYAQPVVLLTGAETRDLCTSATAYGASACLCKPANVDELIWALECAASVAPESLPGRMPERSVPRWAHY